MTNVEAYLAYLDGSYEGELPEPREIRTEKYLAHLCGMEVGELPLPRPIWIEIYLYKMATEGVGGGGGSDAPDVIYGEGLPSDRNEEVLESAALIFGELVEEE